MKHSKAIWVLIMGMAALVMSSGVAGGSAGGPGDEAPLGAESMTAAQRFDALLEKARSTGKVRVIVKLASPSVSRALIKPGQERKHRAKVAALQKDVLDAVRQRTALNDSSIKKFRIVPGFALEASPETIAALQENPQVETIVEDGLNRPYLFQSVPLVGAGSAWGQGYSGLGQAVAVLDSGVDKTHPFLNGKVVSEACYSTNYSAAGLTVSSFCPGGAGQSTASGAGVNCNPSIEGCSHGTHVAGIIAGKDGASSGGTISGVARDAGIIAIQVFSRVDSISTCGSASPCILAYDSDIVLGLERVFALRGAFNIASANMSLGGGQYTATCDASEATTKAAIDNLRAAGIATVIASGNEGWNGATGSPGCISTAITVGSSTKSDVESSFNNAAPWVDLMAPGSSICSSVAALGSAAASCGAGSGSFEFYSGTSMATPHVAGAWAVLKSKKTDASVSEIETALKTTGAPVSTYLGNWPRISLVPALAMLDSSAVTTLIQHYYSAILERTPDASGQAFWEGEAQRMTGLGVDPREALIVMANYFFNSPEYLARGTSDTVFLGNLYRTFFNRDPDTGGLNYWLGQLQGGLPRDVAMYGFLFSPEFNNYMSGLLGSYSSRAEVLAVVDYYRGILGRLPDTDGFNHWVGRFRQAQCNGAGAVYSEAQAISQAYFGSAEYASRNHTNTQYVSDLYNAFLRRGGDLAGVNHWIQQLDNGIENRTQLQTDFIASPEFSARINAIVSQGCL